MWVLHLRTAKLEGNDLRDEAEGDLVWCLGTLSFHVSDLMYSAGKETEEKNFHSWAYDTR